MKNENILVYRCYLEEIPVLEIYLDGSYKVLTESDPEIAELMEQAVFDMNTLIRIRGRGPLTQKEIDEAFIAEYAEAYSYRGAISNEERLKRYVLKSQESIRLLKEPRDPHEERYVANDAKYDAAFATLEQFGFSPNNLFLPLGSPEVEYYGEGEPWVSALERTCKGTNSPDLIP